MRSGSHSRVVDAGPPKKIASVITCWPWAWTRTTGTRRQPSSTRRWRSDEPLSSSAWQPFSIGQYRRENAISAQQRSLIGSGNRQRRAGRPSTGASTSACLLWRNKEWPIISYAEGRSERKATIDAELHHLWQRLYPPQAR